MPYDRDDQNQANVSSAKYYMLRAFPENFFETDNYTDVRNNKCNQVWNVMSIMALTVWRRQSVALYSFVDYCMLSIRI